MANNESLSFLPLLLVLALAFLVPVLISRVHRLRIPVVVGEIIAGIIIGRSGLNWAEHADPVLALLSEFGFVFLMFLSGMEIDFSKLSLEPGSKGGSKQWGPIRLGWVSFLLSLLFSLGVGLALQWLGLVQNPWMMALILSTTSLGVVLPVLKENRLATGRFGQSLLMAALIADFATMLLITVLVTALSHGLTLDILLVGLLFVAFIFMYRFGLFFNRIPAVRRMMQELDGATTQIKVRATFTLMLVFVALSEVLGAEVILGAFLAGAIVSLVTESQEFEMSKQLSAVGFGFFIPIFFIVVGIDFNLPALLSSSETLLLLPLLLVAAYAVKLIPGLVFRFAFPWPETVAAGSLLSARLSLIIAASAIGLRMGLISDEVNAEIILVAIITVVTGPMLFNQLHPRAVKVTTPPILIFGAERLGLQLAAHLQAHHERLVLIDHDVRRVDEARSAGFSALQGMVEEEDSEVTALLNHVHTLVCTYSDPALKHDVCRVARTSYGIDRVITMLGHGEPAHRFTSMGVTAIALDLDWAMLLTMVVRSPAAYELLTREDDDHDVREVTMRNRELEGIRLRRLPLPGNVRLLAIRRQGELLVPAGATRLQWEDHLSLAGNEAYLEDACRMMTPTVGEQPSTRPGG